MSWARIDDNAPLHPKLLRAGAEAAWLWVCGLAWAGRNRKAGGRIPRDVLHSLYPGAWSEKRLAQLASKLVEVRLWEAADDAFVIHDVADYAPGGDGGNERPPPKTDAERARDARRRRREASRDASRDDVTPDVRDPSRDGDRDVTASRAAAPARAHAHPVPSRPVPSPGESEMPPTEPPVVGPSNLSATLAGVYALEREKLLPRLPYENFHRDRVAWDVLARTVEAHAARTGEQPVDVGRAVVLTYLGRDRLRARAWPPEYLAKDVEELLVARTETPATSDGSYTEEA